MSLGQMTLLMVKNQGGLRLPVQAGRQRSMGMLFPSSLPTGREECTGLWDPSAAAGKGRKESFAKVWGAGEGDSDAAFLVTHCSNVPIWAFCRGFAAKSHLARFIFSWDFWLAGKNKLLQTIPISRLDLKWLAEGGEENSLISWSFREGWFSQIFS